MAAMSPGIRIILFMMSWRRRDERSPDGAKRNPGPVLDDSRISLRSIRATSDATAVIASEAKQSSLLEESWIASSLPLLAMTLRERMKWQKQQPQSA
jgi:hypothetical protein